MSSKKRKKRRDRLYKEHPYCHWCGRRLTDKMNGKKFPKNFRTVDHVKSKLSGDRWRTGGQTVLACHECNQDRNRLEQKNLGIHKLRLRSMWGDR